MISAPARISGARGAQLVGQAVAIAACGLALAGAAARPSAPTGVYRRAAPPAQLVLSRRGDRLHVSLWSLQRIGPSLALGLCQTEAEGTPSGDQLVAPVVPFKSFATVVDADNVRRGVGVVRLRFTHDGVAVVSDSFDCGREGGDLTGLYRRSRAPAVTRIPDGGPLPPPPPGLMYRAIHGDPPGSPAPRP